MIKLVFSSEVCMVKIEFGKFPGGVPEPASDTPGAPVTRRMLTPMQAWRMLCRETGGDISRATFYRWLGNGKVCSIRLGYRLFVPRPALEDLIKQCLAGERF
jgi:hypothetical protein